MKRVITAVLFVVFAVLPLVASNCSVGCRGHYCDVSCGHSCTAHCN